MILDRDPEREGYLTLRQIHRCFNEIGLELTKKQIGQLAYHLHRDFDDRVSYPELFELIFGN